MPQPCRRIPAWPSKCAAAPESAGGACECNSVRNRACSGPAPPELARGRLPMVQLCAAEPGGGEKGMGPMPLCSFERTGGRGHAPLGAAPAGAGPPAAAAVQAGQPPLPTAHPGQRSAGPDAARRGHPPDRASPTTAPTASAAWPTTSASRAPLHPEARWWRGCMHACAAACPQRPSLHPSPLAPPPAGRHVRAAAATGRLGVLEGSGEYTGERSGGGGDETAAAGNERRGVHTCHKRIRGRLRLWNKTGCGGVRGVSS